MYKPLKHAGYKKLDIEGYLFYDFIYEISKIDRLIAIESRLIVARGWEEMGVGSDFNGYGIYGQCSGIKSRLNTFVIVLKHKILYSERVIFTVCDLHLKKGVWKYINFWFIEKLLPAEFVIIHFSFIGKFLIWCWEEWEVEVWGWPFFEI